jgi:putative ABC transport system permease protein
MRVVVDERTREIGVKLAVGARRRTILWQFFSESLALMAIGGLAGFGLAAGVLTAVKAFSQRASGDMTFATFIGIPVLNPLVVVSTVLILIAIGVISGIIPARTAASTDPIEALRK